MLKCSIVQKHRKVIKHEIMVHHNFPRPISLRSTYPMKEWKEVEVVNDYNNQLFTILEWQFMEKNFLTN